MSSTRRAAWIVAVSIGAVEALKDQGFCRWNYTIRSVHRHVKAKARPVIPARRLSVQCSGMISNRALEERMKQSEESLKKVMYLSCWAPN